MYNLRGNSQCERFNGIIWNTIKLALPTNDLEIAHVVIVIAEALHFYCHHYFALDEVHMMVL